MATRRDDGNGGIDVVDQPVVRRDTATQRKTQRPPMYKVLLHNDDFTPHEVVMHVLQTVFRMDQGQAFKVMRTAEKTDLCVCGVYTHEVAEQKVIEATELGRKFQCALRFTFEKD